MKNIIRSQLYQMVRQRNLRAVFIGFTALSVMYALTGFANNSPSGSHTVAQTLSMVAITALMLISIFTAYICADDFTDKTANYDVMSGTLRRDVYFGRAILAVAVSVIVGLAHLLTLVISAALMQDWGYQLSIGAVMFRIFLMMFVFIRMSCFFVLLSYIFKKPMTVIALNFAMMSGFSVLSGFSEGSLMATGIGSLTYVCSFDTWVAFGLNSGNYYVFEPAIPAGTIISLIVTSLIFAAIYLFVGYKFFHLDDLE